ncbi:hypothetical protein BC831DRAFT_446379 [Entophlyctis helioformis]|nr:hypothetical protein BC831DRAFT_446379 [Entophlyctis helioformis]
MRRSLASLLCRCMGTARARTARSQLAHNPRTHASMRACDGRTSGPLCVSRADPPAAAPLSAKPALGHTGQAGSTRSPGHRARPRPAAPGRAQGEQGSGLETPLAAALLPLAWARYRWLLHVVSAARCGCT